MASGLTSMILTLDEDRAFHDKFCRATIYANLCFVIKAMDAALFSRCDLWLLLLNHYMTGPLSSAAALSPFAHRSGQSQLTMIIVIN